MNQNLCGVYTLLVNGRKVAQFKNLVTRKGREYLEDAAKEVRSIQVLLSSDKSEPSVNRVSLPSSFTVNLSEQENGYKNLSKSYGMSYSRFIFESSYVHRPMSFCKVGISFDSKLFSESLIKDGKGSPIDINLERSDTLTIIYDLCLVYSLVPSEIETKTKILTLEFDDSFDSRILDLKKPLSLTNSRLDPKFDYVLNKIDENSFSVYLEPKGPLREEQEEILIPTNRGSYKLSIKDKESLSTSFPIDGEDFYFTLTIGLNYD